MAHFAKIENDQVTNVIVVCNEVLNETDNDYPVTEQIGQEFIRNVLGLDGLWLQTSYNAKFRGVYAGIGFTYDKENDVFVPPYIPEIDVVMPDNGA